MSLKSDPADAMRKNGAFGAMRKIETSIREFAEGLPVTIEHEKGHVVIHAANEGGLNCTLVPLADVLNWAAKNCPRLVIKALQDADEWDVETWKIDELRGNEPYVNNQDDIFGGT